MHKYIRRSMIEKDRERDGVVVVMFARLVKKPMFSKAALVAPCAVKVAQ